MDAERFRPLLDDDDFPSRSSPWDSAFASPTAGTSSDDVDGTNAPTDGGGARKGGREEEDDLPRIVMLMRLGNVVAAAMLIFGSVRRNDVAHSHR